MQTCTFCSLFVSLLWIYSLNKLSIVTIIQCFKGPKTFQNTLAQLKRPFFVLRHLQFLRGQILDNVSEPNQNSPPLTSCFVQPSSYIGWHKCFGTIPLGILSDVKVQQNTLLRKSLHYRGQFTAFFTLGGDVHTPTSDENKYQL